MKLIEVTDNRPLIWRLVASLLAQDKRVSYFANLPGSNNHMSGSIAKVGNRSFELWIPYRKASAPIAFAFDSKDDEKLTIVPSKNLDIADFTVINLE